jgi:signal transduction histidine kinase
MELLNITFSGWVAISIAVSMAILAGIMFILGKEKAHYVWGVFCGAVAIWATGFYMVTLAQTPDSAQFWWKIAYIGIILNPFTFFHFVIELVNKDAINRHKFYILSAAYTVALVFLYIDLGTNLMINEVSLLFEEIYYNTPPGLLHPYFTAVFLGLVSASLLLVFHEYRKSSDRVFRQTTVYFFIATLIGYIGGSMNFLAVYRIEMHPISNLGVAMGAGIIAYAILRYRLFDIKVVTAQLLTLILVSFSLIQLIQSSSAQEFLFSLFLLLVVLFVGVYLIKSVHREVEQREKISRLAEDLKQANARLKELDRLKTEFVSIASHQLRSPLSAMKGYASMLLEGSFGKLTVGAQEAIGRILTSSSFMTRSVDDFLNVSRIELGRMQYSMSTFDLCKLISLVIAEQRPFANEKKIDLRFEKEVNTCEIYADMGKVKQVLTNLTDNAIKYTPRGSVTLRMDRDKVRGMIRISVEDTGIGMSQNTIKKLFSKFSRADNANEVNVIGTGLGLYVARNLIKAQGGNMWATSPGEKKGSTFHFEIPIRVKDPEESASAEPRRSDLNPTSKSS